jgi:secreted trypsin-like serine protease
MSRKLRTLVAGLGALLASSLSLVASNPATAIVGGQQAASGEFPYVVELTSPTYGGLCTASLIHPSWVLTAAHCSTVPKTTDLQVRIGNDRSRTGGEIVPIKEIRLNPSYAGGPDDVAVLRLQWPSTRRPVRLAQPNETAYWDGAGDFATAVGWGITNPATNTLAASLQKTQVKILPDGADPQGNMRITLDKSFNGTPPVHGPCGGTAAGPSSSWSPIAPSTRQA